MKPVYSAIEMLEKLIGFPTVSRDSNLPLIEFVEGYLSAYGVESTRVYNEDKTKANLYASVGPVAPNGVILSGHTDVVPVDGQDWTTDPFVMTIKDDRIYGRGSCDMKGFLAVCLAELPAMLEADLKRPIHFALSYDEELACLGAWDLVDAMAIDVAKPALVIVGEPTNMQVVTGHKGFMNFITRVRGFEVHSSLYHTGVSAVMTAARLISWIGELSAKNRENADPKNPFVPNWSSLHCGQIEGGTAHNITAKDCWFVTDIRAIAGETPQQYFEQYKTYIKDVIEPEMQRIQPGTGIDIEILSEVPGLEPEIEGAAEQIARSITGDNGVHVVSYGTEAGQFQGGGFSAVVCGPGSIEQAHQPDEYLFLSELEAGTRFIQQIIQRQTT
ncbi:MAG: acetylornithine deacetylase [Hyphomicrobiales bacterium]|nr:MAG: acetylornithine deacetylase [Hyphomicrobiales bacterium]